MIWDQYASDPYFENDAVLLDYNYTPLTNDQITLKDALRGEYFLADSHPVGILIAGSRYDPYLAAANLLRSIRASNKWAVDSADANLKTSNSQAIATMERLEADYRRSARIGSITFSRSDLAGC